MKLRVQGQPGSTEQVPGQSGTLRETLPQNKLILKMKQKTKQINKRNEKS